MSVPEFEKLEFRICLIGEDFVGKKTLLNRFKNMKATDTLEFPNPPKTITKHIDKIRQKPCDKTEIKSEVPKIKTKIANLANFTKVIRIERNYLEFNFFLVPAAEKVGFSDNLNEDDETEKLHKMKFLNVRTYFKEMLAKPGKENISVRYIFLFMFDITIAETFDKAKVYFDEINKITNFQKNVVRNFFPILLGNKIDLKYPYEAIDREALDAYVKEKNVKFYESSGKLYFNFENFFLKLFFDLFENEYPAFSTQIFKDRFADATLNVKTIPSYPKPEFVKDNGVPAPSNYQPNVYDLTNVPEFDLAFDRSKRYNNKIFLNKLGPVFEFIKEDFTSRKEKKKDSPKRNVGKSLSSQMEDEMKKKKIKDMNQKINLGFSFGLKTSINANLKEKRRAKTKAIKRNLDNFFDLENITIKKEESNSPPDSESEISVREALKEKKNNLNFMKMAKREKRLEKVQVNQNRISTEVNKRNDLYISKLEKEAYEDGKKIDTRGFSVSIDNYQPDEDYEKNIENSYASESPSKKERIRHFLNQRYNIENISIKNTNRKKPEEFITPGPAEYDIRNDLTLKKKFTIGAKHIIKNVPLSSLAPKDSVVIRSDIDDIPNKPKFANTNAKRFKEKNVYIAPYPEEICK